MLWQYWLSVWKNWLFVLDLRTKFEDSLNQSSDEVLNVKKTSKQKKKKRGQNVGTKKRIINKNYKKVDHNENGFPIETKIYIKLCR